MNVLLGVTGGVAATLTPKLVAALKCAGHDVKVIATKTSFYFFDPSEVDAPILKDEDEWPDDRYTRGDPVLHIELRDWADVLLIAPLTASTLAKMAHGFSDNMLQCVFLAWNETKPIVLAPAMNTKMWEHPMTQRNISTLTDALVSGGYSLLLVNPIVKTLACGDVGIGAMTHVRDIVSSLTR